MGRRTLFTDERVDGLYIGEGSGGDNTLRARVIRELVDEIRALRRELGSPMLAGDGPEREQR